MLTADPYRALSQSRYYVGVNFHIVTTLVVSARGLYHRSGIHQRYVERKWHPAPKAIFCCENYTKLLRFDDALDRADRDALGRIVVTNALHAGGCVDDVDIAFGDGIGGAFGDARAAGDAVFIDFHCHGKHSSFKIFNRVIQWELSVN